MTGENLPFPFNIPQDLYRSFLITYGTSSVGRMAVEAYKQLVVLETAWYDAPTAIIVVLEKGFFQHALLALAAAEALNMVLGAIYKEKIRRQGRREGREEAVTENNRDWRRWLARKAEAEAKGEPFHEPAPDERRPATDGELAG